ncbi:uncharacterized protein LOC144055174 [Vanacampus margaritifer]
MKLLLAVVLIVLLSWLYRSWISNSTMHSTPCEGASVSETVVSLLLCPLSLYSSLTSTLVRLVLSVPPLVFTAIRHSVMLLVATPVCVLSLFMPLLLTCVCAGLYLLHVVLVGGVAIWTLTQEPVHEKVKHQGKRRLRMSGWVK